MEVALELGRVKVSSGKCWNSILAGSNLLWRAIFDGRHFLRSVIFLQNVISLKSHQLLKVFVAFSETVIFLEMRETVIFSEMQKIGISCLSSAAG